MSKKVIICLIFSTLIVSTANASYYIINTDTNRAVSRTEYLPDAKDLESRGEVAVRVSDSTDIELNEAELFQGKIQKRVKSQEEINAEQIESQEKDEMKEIYHIMFKEAYKAAVKEGKTFNLMGKHVDNIEDVKSEALVEKQIMDDLKNK